jgi:pyochelin biosynthesis protein PchC
MNHLFQKLTAAIDDNNLFVIFPHAGSLPMFFWPLASKLTCTTYVLNNESLAEPDWFNVIESASEWIEREARAFRSVSILGHSLGSLIAYQTALRLEGTGVPLGALTVAGSVAPSHVDFGRIERLALATENELTDFSESLLGPIRVSADDRAMLNRMLRRDLAFMARCPQECRTVSPLAAPLNILVSNDDALAPPEQMKHWSNVSPGAMFHHFVGGHFFLRNYWAEIVSICLAPRSRDGAQ